MRTLLHEAIQLDEFPRVAQLLRSKKGRAWLEEVDATHLPLHYAMTSVPPPTPPHPTPPTPHTHTHTRKHTHTHTHLLLLLLLLLLLVLVLLSFPRPCCCSTATPCTQRSALSAQHSALPRKRCAHHLATTRAVRAMPWCHVINGRGRNAIHGWPLVRSEHPRMVEAIMQASDCRWYQCQTVAAHADE